MTPEDRLRFVQALDAGVRWILASGIRSGDGGLRSIYRPGSGAYVTYGGGASCLQCTAGGVLALLAAAKSPRASAPGSAERFAAAVESADHILGLIVSGPGPAAGAIPCGLEAGSVKTLHTEAALKALLAVHEATGDARWLDAAARAGRWAISKLQKADGSFRGGAGMSTYARIRRRLLDTSPLGAAAYVRTLKRLGEAAGDPSFERAASRLFGWLRRQQDEDGGFPMYRYPALTRPLSAPFHGGMAEVLRGCVRYHPSPNAWMIDAFLAMDDEEGARRVSAWLLPRLGPNGLLYQFYFATARNAAASGRAPGALPGGVIPAPYGARSVEEDVMPTASLALQWMGHPGIVPEGKGPEVVARIAAGVVGSQARGGDRRTDGGFRGLPLHPKFNDDIYAWDTAFGILFLAAYLHHNPGPVPGS